MLINRYFAHYLFFLLAGLPLPAVAIGFNRGKRQTAGSRLKFFILVCFSLFFPNSCLALVYGEHKVIGDRAFTRAMLALKQEEPSALLHYLARITTHPVAAVYEFPGMSASSLGLSYGTLNALAGDHQLDPVLMEQQLKDPGSMIHKIISLHQSYLEKGLKAAPDGELVKLDYRYALAAAINASHFYMYGQSFKDHLSKFDLMRVKQASNRAYLSSFVIRLHATNVLLQYVSLHLVAIDLAEKSGRLIRTETEEASDLLQQALFLNGFADHFLEDAFSAGHLVVNRTMLASLTNNKALHDFYSEHGTLTVNRKGEIWRCYGDGHIQEESLEEERIVSAVQASVQDLFNAFTNAYTDTQYIKIVDRLPREQSLQPSYLLEHLPALGFVPVPYSFKLAEQMPASLRVTEDMQQANQPLYYRNFVKSRVGNSFVISRINILSRKAAINGFECRINTVNFSRSYLYNHRGTKKGQADYWHGYTLSYNLLKGQTAEQKQSSYQLSGGLRSNLDYWLSDKRFLGIYGYLETGLRFENRKTALIFMPSVGVHLGSLFNINYYNMPAWLRIPAMVILPLKVRYGSVFSLKYQPTYLAAGELDLVF